MPTVTYRAPKRHIDLMKRAAREAGARGYTTLVREAAERVAREILDEAERAEARRQLRRLLDQMDDSDQGLSEEEAARLGVEAQHATRGPR